MPLNVWKGEKRKISRKRAFPLPYRLFFQLFVSCVWDFTILMDFHVTCSKLAWSVYNASGYHKQNTHNITVIDHTGFTKPDSDK